MQERVNRAGDGAGTRGRNAVLRTCSAGRRAAVTFDPIVTPTVPVAPHREPHFVHGEARDAARQRLDDYPPKRVVGGSA